MGLKEDMLVELSSCLDNESVQKVSNVIDMVAYKYNIEERSSELAVYDDCNQRILKRFIATKRLAGLSEKSITQYSNTVCGLFSSIHQPLKDITTNDIRYYLADYKSRNNISNSSLDNMRRYLSTFFGWCFKDGFISVNPMASIDKIKCEKRVKTSFNAEDLERLRCGCKTIRNRALIEFLYSTGCRVSEVVNLNISDINYSDMSIIVRGKGDKEREVFISLGAMYYLKEYLSIRQDNDNALFVGKRGRLTKEGIETIIKNIGDSVGIKAHPHKFRRTIATDLLSKGMPVQEVQKMLGHESIDTTMIYCTVDANNVKSSHRKYA